MTSINDRAKTAREKATPGPWVYEEHKYCPYFEALHLADALGYPEPDQKESGCSNPTDPECVSCEVRYEVIGNPDGVWAANPPYHEASPVDMSLAALAPEAADEVIRIHSEIKAMRERCIRDMDHIKAKDQITPTDGARLSELGRKLSGLNYLLYPNPNGDTND